MKPYPRICRTFLWGGATLVVLFLVLWGASERWVVFSYFKDWFFGMGPGGVHATQGTSTMYRVPDGWYIADNVAGVDQIVWPGCEVMPNRVYVQIPFWTLAVFAGIASCAAWRFEIAAKRRTRAEKCARCGYARTGLAADVVCPECGSKCPAA